MSRVVTSLFRNVTSNPQGRATISNVANNPDDHAPIDDILCHIKPYSDGKQNLLDWAFAPDGERAEKKERDEPHADWQAPMAAATLGFAAGKALSSNKHHKRTYDDNTTKTKCKYASLVSRIVPRVFSKPTFVNHMGNPSLRTNNKITKPVSKPESLPIAETVIDDIKNSQKRIQNTLNIFESNVQNWTALEMINKGLYPEAFQKFESSSKLNPSAVYNLGVCNMQGIGQEANIAKAVQLWEKAAVMGHAKSHYQLATCYIKGIGGLEDRDKALLHMQVACDKNLPQAQLWMGCYYLKNGDMEKGLSLVHKANVAGLIPAATIIHKLKSVGYEVPQHNQNHTDFHATGESVLNDFHQITSSPNKCVDKAQ